MVLATVVAMPVAASAAPNPAIVVSGVTITSEDGGQATVGDTLAVSGAWDATTAAPEPGDSFTIGLPPELAFPEAVPFNLVGPDPDGNQVIWGTCLTDPATDIATCTLTDEVAVNSELVKGTWEFEVEAVQATTEDDVVFDLNGTDTPVELPGGGGIDDGIILPDDWSKAGAMNANNWSMTWTIELPGARLASHEAVNIADTLSASHQLCDPADLKVMAVRGSSSVDVTSIAQIVPGADPQHFTIRLTAPEPNGFDANVTYRITYQTCTPDQQIDDPATEYTNHAAVDIWGESSGVIGIHPRPWHQNLTKSGSVLGGGQRNGTVRWTVTVPGSQLAGKDGFTLTETLAGDHEVCSDTISGIRIIERYGPSSQRQSVVTGQLTPTTVSSSATGFEVRFDIPSDSSFAFQASDWRYLIEYTTCVTTDGLPEAGTAFTNTANVDGKVAGTEAKVPGRTDRKTGGINTSAVTIDGVQHLPQTTMNWNITVPGERLQGITGPLTVTDTLGGAHQVCAAGSDGSIDARLHLKVEARDQIQNGGLATVDLTSTASAALSDGTITVTIPQPTLPQPDGTDATGFSREYQYIVTYTTCTTSGGMDAPGTRYDNSATVAGKTYTHSVTQNNRGSGTGQGVPRGSVAVSKLIADTPGAAFVPDGTVFTVHAKEIDATGVTQVEYDLAVPLDGTPASGFNQRGTGWTIELSEPAFPAVPGVTFAAPVFAPGPGVTVNEGGTVATAALTPNTNIAVTLTNTAQLGSVQVQKALEGPASDLAADDLAYEITAHVDTTALGAGFPAQTDRTFTLEAGGPAHLLDNLPIGATVTFSEVLPADDDILTWSPVVFSPESVVVTADHVAEPATVTATNRVERTVGTFSLVKSVTGDQADNPAVPDTVTVTATWNEEGTPGSKTLTLPTDGTPVALGESLLIGTEVTLTETPLADGSSIAWGAPVWSGTGVAVDGASAVVTIGRDADATVTLENHAATSTAGISLLKGVAGAAAGEVPDDTGFPVTVTWTDPDGVDQTRELTIDAVEPTPLGEDLPAGTVVTVTEGARPGFDTVIWGSITISGTDVTDAGDGSATVVVSDQQDDVTLVTVVNEATWAPGTFSLTKDVAGVLLDNPDVPEDVTVTATWLDAEGAPQTKELTLPTDGTVVPFGADLPHETLVTLTEAAPADADAFTWGAPVWAGDAEAQDDGSAQVIIGAATVAEVHLTNTAVPTLGSLSLVKELIGAGADDVPAGTGFPVTLSWTDLMGDPQLLETTITASAPTVVDGIPFGTDITVAEGTAQLPGSIRWEGVTWSTDDERVQLTTDGDVVVTVVGEPGAEAALTATNEFTEVPPLAITGLGLTAEQLAITVGAAIAALAVGAWLIIRRRKHAM